MTAIELASVEELCNELVKRCTATVIAMQRPDEGDELLTTSMLEGNFITISGLVSLLQMRASGIMEDRLYNED